MIGLDFPLKPEWIHDVHQLWQPDEPISGLVARALAASMQELGGEKTRRNSLGILLRYFVATSGGGQSRRTFAQDLWVTYSRKYAATTLAPAYLVQLIANNEMAGEIVRFINRRYSPGDVINSADIRSHVISKYGERKVVTNAASAFLRTLQYFSVLEPARATGQYRVSERLILGPEVFPLAFWALWNLNPVPQVDLDAFNQSLEDSFVDTDNLDQCWKRYQPALWVVSERVDARFAAVKYPDVENMKAILLA